MGNIDQLNAAVTRNKDAVSAAVQALNGQLQIIKDAGTPAERDAAIAALQANTDALAAAIVAGTPNAP